MRTSDCYEVDDGKHYRSDNDNPDIESEGRFAADWRLLGEAVVGLAAAQFFGIGGVCQNESDGIDS